MHIHYTNRYFEYRNSINQNEVFGNIHHIHYNNTPVHKHYTISLSAIVPKSLLSKTYIAKTDKKENINTLEENGKIIK